MVRGVAPAASGWKLTPESLSRSPRAYWKAVFDEIATKIAARIQERVAAQFQSKVKVSIEQPKQNSFGELAIPIAFQLARELKRPPRQIAQELAGEIEHMPEVASLEIAGNGYINIRLARGAYADSILRADGANSSPCNTARTRCSARRWRKPA